MESRPNRRLAAILAADIAGYSRLVGLDEEGTIDKLRRIRAEVIEPLIAGYSGRIANTAGDSFLIEFPSAVDAVRAAVEIQTELLKRNSDTEPDRAIVFRIGLNVGDVVSNADDILGDGVNVAARLEALAEPGGIIASQAIVGYARNKVPFAFTPIGPQSVKNIADPIEAFRVETDALTPAVKQKTKKALHLMKLAAILIVLGAAGYIGTKTWEKGQLRASEAQMAYPLPDLPSIAVLPLTNFTSDASNKMLIDGVSEDLITDLSRISGLFVIAGNTSFAFRDRDIDVAGFAEKLGVRYVVDGSLRRSGEGFRVNIRLTDTLNGRLIWAERFDGEIDEIFDLQNNIVLAIAHELDVPLDTESRIAIENIETEKIEAREAFQRGWELYSRFNEQDNQAAIPHFERAVELDPNYARAWAMLAMVHLRPHIFHHWSGFANADEQMHIGLFYKYYRELTHQDTSLIHVIRAIVALNLPDWDSAEGVSRGTEEARQEAAKAIALQPSDPESHLTMGWALIAGGEPEEGLAFVQAAMRLDPEYPSHYALFQGAALFAMNDLTGSEAVIMSELDRNPQAVELMPFAASILALNGDRNAARAMIERWQKGENESVLDEVVREYFFIVRWIGEHQHLNTRLKNGLQLAALPPSTTVASLKADLMRGDAKEQRDAAQSLALFGADAAPAVPELIMLLGSPSVFVRKEAAIALGEIGEQASPALPALEANADGSLSGRFAARAIEQIRGASQ
ncbi:adenylate/guanylate cyclase domain-containing protein [Ruegeria sp. HKCCSP351]|uniref:adenylate/guanylate cyclase domain-containing protein n=1 Tax=Ruegeria sp. HKCCSP351 TaxID=2794832 RepID=UPI001AE12585|nr:adenylate/guanylate cyclase domain-containing protein [Ruegeria sp. HKCCSP351]